MLKQNTNSDILRKSIPLFAVCAAIPFVTFAQDSDEEYFELSPFEVVADEDEGYRAEYTLSGSRLNSALKDVPAVVDVSTKDYLDDLGVTDFQELMEYQGNTQVHDFEENGATNSGTFNSSLPNERVTYRTRGFTGTNTRDFIKWNSPDDVYNVDRYDFSKGPNGVLFGLGSVGGTANATTKRAMIGRDFNTVVLQVGSWDHMRMSADFNKVLIKDKLAVRLNMVDQDSEGYRYNAFKDVRRFAAAATYRIAKRTTFRIAYEDGEQDVSSHRPFGPWDQFSEWMNEGMVTPTFNNGRANNLTNQGVQSRGGNTNLVAMPDGTAYNMIHSPRSTVYNDKWNQDPFRANYAGRIITPDSTVFGQYAISDRIAFEGPDCYNHADWDKLLATFEHSFTDKLHSEVTFFKEKLSTYGQNPGGTSVFVDLVENYGDPTSDRPYNTLIAENPYYGDFYMENVWRTNSNFRDIEGVRGTISYDLDLTSLSEGWLSNILGSHRIAALAENREEIIDRENTYEVLTTESRLAAGLANTNGNAEHARNRIWRRNYVTFGDWENFHTGRFPTDMTVSLPLADGTVQALDTTFVPTGQNAISYDIVTDDALMAAAQSFFFNNRIITTMGYRVDRVDIDRSQSVRDTVGNTGVEDFDGDGVTGEWVLLTDDEYRYTDEVKGITRSFGIVGHLTDRLSLFANHSSGRKLPSVGQQIAPYGQLAPGESGESIDYGFSFDLFGGKVKGRVNRYETDGYDRFIWSNSGAPGVASRVMDALQALKDPTDPTYITDEEVDAHVPTFNGGLADTITEGYGVRLVGNVTRNMSLVFNYSYSTRRFENVLLNNYEWMLNETDYYAEKLAEVGLDLDSDIGLEWTSDGVTRQTVNDAIGHVLGRVTRDQLLKGLGFNERPHKVSMTANYKFTEGLLKGLSLGGSVRWQDKSVIDASFDFEDLDYDYVLDYNEVNLDADGIIDVKDFYHSTDTFMADFMMKYRLNDLFGKNTYAELQLNVRNLFDNTDILPAGYNNAFSAYSQYRFQEPRSFRVTLRVRF